MATATTRQCAVLLALVAALGPGEGARAQEPPAAAEVQENPALSRIRELTQQARAAFNNYSYRAAQQKLEQALEIAKEAHLAKGPELTQTNLLLGITCVGGLNDMYRGLHYFVQALRLQSSIQVPKELATPQLLDMFGRARQAIKVIGKPPRVDLGTAGLEQAGGRADEVKAGGLGLIHEAVDSAKRGLPIPIRAVAGIDVQASKAHLFFRPAGIVEFTRLMMIKVRNTFRIAIPAEATQGRYIHYYIEALDQRGRLTARQGSARSPNVIIIKTK